MSSLLDIALFNIRTRGLLPNLREKKIGQIKMASGFRNCRQIVYAYRVHHPKSIKL